MNLYCCPYLLVGVACLENCSRIRMYQQQQQEQQPPEKNCDSEDIYIYIFYPPADGEK